MYQYLSHLVAKDAYFDTKRKIKRHPEIGCIFGKSGCIRSKVKREKRCAEKQHPRSTGADGGDQQTEESHPGLQKNEGSLCKVPRVGSSASRDGRRHSIESIRRIEAHKEAQAVYSAANGKLPTLAELSEEYDLLLNQKRETGEEVVIV